MSQVEQRTLDALDANGIGVRVEFRRESMRWTHRILAVVGDQMTPLLESLEGDDSQNFPPSPALQQLAFQDLSDGRKVALLVGMAGNNHWSVGVESQPEQGVIRFDVACRNQPCQVGRLGSSYKPLAKWRVDNGLEAANQQLHVQLGPVTYALVPALAEQTNPQQVQQLDDGTIQLQVSVDQTLRTQRWCYDFRHQ